MDDYYITPVDQEEALPFIRDHMSGVGDLYDPEWLNEFKGFIHWFGARFRGEIKGIMGIMVSDTMPEDLIIVEFHGCPHAIIMLGGYILKYPHKNKFGYVSVRNEKWLAALQKRGYNISPIVEHDKMGNKIRCVGIIGDQDVG